jgi:hypothetical protein
VISFIFFFFFYKNNKRNPALKRVSGGFKMSEIQVKETGQDYDLQTRKELLIKKVVAEIDFILEKFFGYPDNIPDNMLDIDDIYRLQIGKLSTIKSELNNDNLSEQRLNELKQEYEQIKNSR